MYSVNQGGTAEGKLSSLWDEGFFICEIIGGKKK